MPDPHQFPSEALKDPQKILSNLLSYLPGMIYRCRNDRDWTLEYISEGCIELTGYTPVDFVENRKISYGRLMHPDDKEPVWEAVQAALKARRPYQLIYRIGTAQGEGKWVWEQGQGLFGAEGELLALEGYITDITQWKRAEKELQESEQRFRVLVENSPDVIMMLDRNGTILFINRTLPQYTVQGVLGTNVREYLSAEDTRRYMQAIRETFDLGEPRTVEMDAVGPTRWLARINPIRKEGRVEAAMVIASDITHSRKAEDALDKSRRRYEELVHTVNGIVWEADAETFVFTFVSKQAEAILGYSLDRWTADPKFWAEHIHPEDREWVVASCTKATAEKRTNDLEYRMIAADGRTVWVRDLVTVVVEKDRPAKLRGVMVDITHRKRNEAMVQQLAYYDLLTDLPNWLLLHDRLQQSILTGQREGKPAALLLMDLDRFKEINDTLGHQRGNLVLQQIGPRLRTVLRESDTVARLGGDEFAVMLPSADSEAAIRTARKILSVMETPLSIEGLPIDVGLSIGIAIYPDHGSNADGLLQRADVAMYQAKQSGSGYSVYVLDQDRHSPRRLALMGELRHSIEREELVLHYQPRVDLRTGRIVSVEALVRWRHPKSGLILPDEFIPVAEQTGLIRSLTQWVLETAFRQCRAWHDAGYDFGLSVNLSARVIFDPDLAERIVERLKSSRLPARTVELEITETAIMADPVHAKETLAQLRAAGLRISIDDFGVGYSSLGYLKKLPIDEIKIDKSFVTDMMIDEDNHVIVHSTIDLAHNLGLKVVAEGVEGQEALDGLIELGCDSAQGYYLGRPVHPKDLERWLSDSSWGQKRM